MYDLHFVRCTVDLCHVISLFGYTAGLCQSPLASHYEVSYHALLIDVHEMSSALVLSHIVRLSFLLLLNNTWTHLSSAFHSCKHYENMFICKTFYSVIFASPVLLL